MKINSKGELIRFIMNSSDTNRLVIAAFIAGMQAQNDINSHKTKRRQPRKP